ncbi:MAG: hypothetical protein ACLGI5_20800 [Thermoleophilia bacterium]
MTIAQQLIPKAGQAGYVPVTDLPWLEHLREQHERLVAQLATAVLVPDRIREDHDAAVAAWSDQVRVAARSGDEPPEWCARLSAHWLAGLVDAAEATIAGTVDEIVALLFEVDAACDEHGIDAAIAPIDDGFGGALTAMERRLVGDEAPLPLPPWADGVRSWRQFPNQRAEELQRFRGRGGGRRDANPFGGQVAAGTTLVDHAAEERERMERVRAANAADALAAASALDEYPTGQIAPATTTEGSRSG